MALNYLLDTNICIYIAKQKPLSVLNKFKKMSVGDLAMSMITYGELYYGASKSHHSEKALGVLENLVSLIPALPMPTQAGKFYGEIRGVLEKKGKMIGNNDLWIAAHALALDVTLITHNMKEFLRIDKLKIENWVD
jgi:tRNA(fMet)-specific endonuclease VapC